jgi:hypothetical protein
VSGKRANYIKALISSLAGLDKADFGLSSTRDAYDFCAVSAHKLRKPLTQAHNVSHWRDALRSLVSLGPEALPYLLQALDDKRPCKLTIQHESTFGWMWFGGELRGNPVNPTEASLFSPRPDLNNARGGSITSYTVKVGDVCFVAIGQIVGRGYQAVRYQASACIVVNSPTRDAALRDAVRTTWASKQPAQKLFYSLLADYTTAGIFDGKSLDSWSWASDLQCQAALRLLYYFPKEALPLVLERLHHLRTAKAKNLDDYIRRCVADGVRSEDFIRSISWCKAPAIRARLMQIFRRSNDLDIMLAALAGVDDNRLIHDRLDTLFRSLPATEDTPVGEGFRLLRAFGSRPPSIAKTFYENYLRGASPQRCQTVCLLLREVRPVWSNKILIPLLSDKRCLDDQTNPADPGGEELDAAIRVCDMAAAVLVEQRPVLRFVITGGHKDRDKQIAAICEAILPKK